MIKLQLKNISDFYVVLAYDLSNKLIDRPYPYELIQKWFCCNEKLAYKVCERADKRGLIEYGVSLRTGWLTDKGLKLLENHK